MMRFVGLLAFWKIFDGLLCWCSWTSFVALAEASPGLIPAASSQVYDLFEPNFVLEAATSSFYGEESPDA